MMYTLMTTLFKTPELRSGTVMYVREERERERRVRERVDYDRLG